MTTEGLKFLNKVFDDLQIPYEFGKWTSTVPDTYWTGSYIEAETMSEDGLEETDFFITGNTTEGLLELERIKERLRYYFGNNGMTVILESGSGIAIMYANATPLQSVEYGVDRLEILLKVKEWRC